MSNKIGSACCAQSMSLSRCFVRFFKAWKTLLLVQKKDVFANLSYLYRYVVKFITTDISSRQIWLDQITNSGILGEHDKTVFTD